VEEIDNLGLKPAVRRKFMRDNVIRIYGLENKIK
jgi:predicted TIM-barrel fold metal-dependent hydrolase